jgi:hypothetical protein
MARKPDLKKLKVHFLGGCNFAAEKLEPKARLEPYENKWGPNPEDVYHGWNAIPQTTNDLTEVTCGYCKTKLTNEIWFADWSKISKYELDFLTHLRAKRHLRKSQET